MTNLGLAARLPRVFVATAFTAALTAAVGMPAPAQADDTAPPASDGVVLEAPAAADNDPLEGLNRVTAGFNRVLRDILLDPMVDGYKAVTPDIMQEGITNFASNLTEPVTAASSLLQGDTDNAGRAVGRFLINTTAGFGGINDAATDMGMEQRREDLGQSAGAAGFDEGVYVVLPIIGPSNLRDAGADALTSLANPAQPFISGANAATGYAANKDAIKSTLDSALDPYVVEREAYRQKRRFEISNGQEVEQTTASDFPTLK